MEYKTLNVPEYVGHYQLDKGWTRFYFREKPKWIHRYFMKLLLGWEWKDD